jgi:hypothetical protein
MANTGYETNKVPIWSCDIDSSYDTASSSWKRSIALKCEALAGSLNGSLDPRVAVEQNISADLWFAPPGGTLFGTFYADCITIGNLREIMSMYFAFLVDPNRQALNGGIYTDDGESFVRLLNFETYARFLHGPDKLLSSDDLARKRIPRDAMARSPHSDPISNRCITQFHQAWSIICSHLEVSTLRRVEASAEIEIARSNSDIVHSLYELDLMGVRGNLSDQDVRRRYEEQLLEPDKYHVDQASKYGSSIMGLTNYNDQSKKLYKSAVALKTNNDLVRCIIGYFRGLHPNFEKTHLHSLKDNFKSFQEAIDYVNLSAIGMQQMNCGNWELPPTSSTNNTGVKRDLTFFRNRPHNGQSSSSSASGGGYKYPSNGTSAPSIMHTQVSDEHDEEAVFLKNMIDTAVAKSFEVFATNSSIGNPAITLDCNAWINTGHCWRIDACLKNPAVKCKYRHPDLKTFTPPYPHNK